MSKRALSPQQFHTLYHGTRAENVEGLRSEGLRQPPGTYGPGWPQLTDSLPQAQRYSRDGTVAEYHVPKSKVWSSGKKTAVLWPGQAHSAYGFPEATGYAVKDSLPGKYLRKIHKG